MWQIEQVQALQSLPGVLGSCQSAHLCRALLVVAAWHHPACSLSLPLCRSWGAWLHGTASISRLMSTLPFDSNLGTPVLSLLREPDSLRWHE